MELKKIKPVFKDDRGNIIDILVNVPTEHVSIISSKKGAIRGNHFHKETIQWVYLHSGKLKSLTQNTGEEIISKIMIAGDLIRTEKLEKHSLTALEDSEFIVLTKGPRGGKNYENDTFRLKIPLNDPDENE
tara:strand:+ start:6443 stop:6835 length:393 start_codon:yes stop_codon:yes gene_type:complete